MSIGTASVIRNLRQKLAYAGMNPEISYFKYKIRNDLHSSSSTSTFHQPSKSLPYETHAASTHRKLLQQDATAYV